MGCLSFSDSSTFHSIFSHYGIKWHSSFNLGTLKENGKKCSLKASSCHSFLVTFKFFSLMLEGTIVPVHSKLLNK